MKITIESVDIDNCITLFKKYHKEAHSHKDCRYTDLANYVGQEVVI